MAKDDYPSYPGGDYHPENDNSSGGQYGGPNDPGYWSDDSAGYGASDNPYGTSAGQPGYGANDPYGTAGYAGAAPYGAGGRRMVQGDGKVRVLDSVGYGFRTVFASPGPWIVSSLIVGILSIAAFTIGLFMMMSSLPEGGTFDPENPATAGAFTFNIGFLILFILILVAAQVLFASAALKAADGKKVTFSDFFDNPNLGKALLFLLIVNILTSWVPYIIPDMYNSDTTGGLIVQMIINLAVLLIGPLFMLMFLFVLDQGASFGDAATRGFQAGTRNYLPLLGFSLLWGLILGIAALILGLGLLIASPAYAAALAYVYRQASGGIYPED
ncbi:hypothetical protein JIM95_007285 [Corynebacterium sp. CCM 8835]|uniref:Integral membrane protein n=1 Tax=Corynebacterium antarcticum TaxID=2800405 RepID=A0ABS1FIB2_9CORY|nr:MULTISPECIES: hypothetical protein [Corynebacterium]MBV7292478.1 hypothetical protein [Corynebacterium sp. TAE3-ERU16]MCK7642124.1 hypothetical protein [Corynebacterium antarcticum]MCK7661194.1 hypothetical protein [Corynebacterium antarcticum]MCL0245941.1 hypothetical protein [Corynebacterium antarcticum]MCX7491601.1 hypothetical protein [Corynebacterium antarcticum]